MNLKHIALTLSLLILALVGGQAHAETLSTTTPNNNGNVAIVFDVQATNELTITQVTSQVAGAGTFAIYGRPGSYVGFDESSDGWTLLGTSAISGAGNFPVGGTLSVYIPAGQRYAFFIGSTGGATVQYSTTNN